MKLSAAAQNTQANSFGALLDGGTVEIRTGTAPANPDTAATGTLLGTLTLANPAFGTASSGTITANAVSGDSSADASGTAGYFRAYNSTGDAVEDGTITATGGGGEMTLDSVSIVAGGTISMTSWTITQPGS